MQSSSDMFYESNQAGDLYAVIRFAQLQDINKSGACTVRIIQMRIVLIK